MELHQWPAGFRGWLAFKYAYVQRNVKKIQTFGKVKATCPASVLNIQARSPSDTTEETPCPTSPFWVFFLWFTAMQECHNILFKKKNQNPCFGCHSIWIIVWGCTFSQAFLLKNESSQSHDQRRFDCDTTPERDGLCGLETGRSQLQLLLLRIV